MNSPFSSVVVSAMPSMETRALASGAPVESAFTTPNSRAPRFLSMTCASGTPSVRSRRTMRSRSMGSRSKMPDSALSEGRLHRDTRLRRHAAQRVVAERVRVDFQHLLLLADGASVADEIAPGYGDYCRLAAAGRT